MEIKGNKNEDRKAVYMLLNTICDAICNFRTPSPTPCAETEIIIKFPTNMYNRFKDNCEIQFDNFRLGTFIFSIQKSDIETIKQ